MRKADEEVYAVQHPNCSCSHVSNKDSITRVYYGDLYTDDGHYMEKNLHTTTLSMPCCVLVLSM